MEELQLAIRSHNLTVDDQPVMRLVPGADPVLHGFEALARWPHPTRVGCDRMHSSGSRKMPG